MAFLDKNGMRLSIIPEGVISRAMQKRRDFEADVFVPDLDDANHPAWDSPAEGRAAHHSLNDGNRDGRQKYEEGRIARVVFDFAESFGDAVWDFIEDYRPFIAGLMALTLAGVGVWAIVRAGAQLL